MTACVHNVGLSRMCFDCITETGSETERVMADKNQTELDLGAESKLGASPYPDGKPPHRREEETSVAAAEAQLPKLARSQLRYLAFVYSRLEGATDQEAAAALGVPLSSICGRRNELMNFTPPLIRKADIKRPSMYNPDLNVNVYRTTVAAYKFVNDNKELI